MLLFKLCVCKRRRLLGAVTDSFKTNEENLAFKRKGKTKTISRLYISLCPFHVVSKILFKTIKQTGWHSSVFAPLLRWQQSGSVRRRWLCLAMLSLLTYLRKRPLNHCVSGRVSDSTSGESQHQNQQQWKIWKTKSDPECVCVQWRHHHYNSALF